MERGLYIVPTPIGNLGDITGRALALLEGAAVIAAEDTRHCRRLLQHFGLDTPVTAYHEHSGDHVVTALCDRVEQGEAVALVSDAGTPLVSDPGYQLVRAAQTRKLPVIPLPGACAAITALSASGLPTDRFIFEGFLPAKRGARRARLERLKRATATQVYYEAPHRIIECLEDMAFIFGEGREATMGRELTKAFETLRRSSLGALLQWVGEDSDQRRGEIVLIVAGADEAPIASVDADTLLERLSLELPPRRAAAVVADLTGARARDLYQRLLSRT